MNYEEVQEYERALRKKIASEKDFKVTSEYICALIDKVFQQNDEEE